MWRGDPTNNRLENLRALCQRCHMLHDRTAPFGAALDHLPPALGSRRSLPRSVPGIDRRADIETASRSIAQRINEESSLFS
jgi:hypothetical protein